MPRYLIFRKSGVHRAACFALYRALLRQKHRFHLNEQQQHLFCKPIRTVFKRNSKLQSPPRITTALQLGYEALEGLHDAVRQQRILSRILEFAIPLRSETTRAVKAPSRHAAPYPGAVRTLARPSLDLSGRRHVPVLVNANRVPFLRIKKPQPPFLSRIIRDTVRNREHRIARAERLAGGLSIAEDEDDWDQVLHEQFGLHLGNDRSEQSWSCEVKQAFDNNHKQQLDATQKRTDVSAEMNAIVEQEKALAKEEKLRIRDEKHKIRKARRLARRGMTESEIQEKLYPQSEKAANRGAPVSTEEVPKQGHGEVRPPNTEEERRVRADNYKTPEELQRLREANLRPKTEEEIAMIKEARARRKEEAAERKAQKIKRKEENTAFWAQKHDEEAEASTIKQLDPNEHRNLNKMAVSSKPSIPGVVRRMEYGRIRRQFETAPQSNAGGMIPDGRWNVV